ncbi:MAG: hypothetical protein BWZ10_00247 [candidate division BRC1 bacterium ADurb.BinA364]|nr:MAG: hypothetical protein BWZ10_00247 [candidate division BRC1 bacterium ADurb.BinA364]
MIGHASLREIVGADALRAVARADLLGAGAGALFVQPLLLEVVQARAQDLEGLGAVLDLRFFVLAGHDQARRQMRQAHGGVGGVDALASRAGRMKGVHFQVFGLDLDFHFLGLGQNGDGDGGGVYPSGGFGDGHALHAVDSAFEFHLAVDRFSFDRKHGFLESAQFGRRGGDQVHFPVFGFAEPLIHPCQIGGEQRRFVAARAGANFQNGVFFVVGIGRQQQKLNLALGFGQCGFAFLDFEPGQLLHLRIAFAQHFARFLQPLFGGGALFQRFEKALVAAIGAAGLRHFLRIAGQFGRRHPLFQFGLFAHHEIVLFAIIQHKKN